ncbi:MAG: hypothetical protein M3R24_28645 [Chloroflexota bacterium]|nr:hypothetical protein [Chloroflexota bacterium]
MSTIVGWFASVSQARQAMLDLITSGIPRQNISVVIGTANSERTQSAGVEPQTGTAEDNDAEERIRPSDFVHSLADATTLTLPDIGPVVAGGHLVTALTEHNSGTANGGLGSALMHIGVPEDQARTYVAELRRGGGLVAVRSDDAWESIVHGVFRHSANPWLREQEERDGPTPARELESEGDAGPISTSIGALTSGMVSGSWGATDAVFEDQARHSGDDQQGREPSL